jgi:hypothetical protein
MIGGLESQVLHIIEADLSEPGEKAHPAPFS